MKAVMGPILLAALVCASFIAAINAVADECHCTAAGDPHYRTFDGVNFDYMGKCKYTLAETLEQGMECSFTVNGLNTDIGINPIASYNGALEIKFMDHVFRFETKNRLVVDKQEIRSRSVTEGDNVQVVMSGNWLTLVSPKCGLRVEFDGWATAYVKLKKAKYGGKVRGLCGNCNGNAGDDFITKTGVRAANALVFANSFITHDEGATRAGCHVEKTPPVVPHPCRGEWEQKARRMEYCGAFLTENNGPFNQCIRLGRVNVDQMYQSCRYDVCVNKGDLKKVKDIVCEALKSFMAACAEHKIDDIDWRGKCGCEMKCPGSMVYQRKIPGCPKSCDSRRKEAACPSTLPFREGCGCAEGLVLFGCECVSPDRCPPNKEVTLSFKRLKQQKTEQTHTIDRGWDQGNLEEGTFNDKGDVVSMKKANTNKGHHKENKTNKQENTDLTEANFDGNGDFFGGAAKFMENFDTGKQE